MVHPRKHYCAEVLQLPLCGAKSQPVCGQHLGNCMSCHMRSWQMHWKTLSEPFLLNPIECALHVPSCRGSLMPMTSKGKSTWQALHSTKEAAPEQAANNLVAAQTSYQAKWLLFACCQTWPGHVSPRLDNSPGLTCSLRATP